ncbi:MAG: ABC transporter ATP-binding protein [Actinomycetota bacterium]|nr:ABC transporter ATP-binding protein [Actinomycetota bacterium]
MTEPPAGQRRGWRGGDVRRGLDLLLGTLRGYPGVAALAIVGALIWMALVVTIPYVVKVIIDDAIVGGRSDLLVPLVVTLVVVGALQGIGIAMRRYFGFRLSYRAEADLRNRMFTHIQRLAFSFHDETPTGQLMARASSDLSQVRLILAMLPITLANLAMFGIVVIVLIVIDPVLGLVASLTVPALFFTANRFAGRVMGLSFRMQQRLADLSQVVEEAVAGIEVVKSYGQEAAEENRLDASAAQIYDDSVSIARFRSTYAPLFELIPALGTVAVLWIGGLRVIDGALSIGDFVAFTQYLAVLVLPLMITGWFFANLPRAAAAASRIDELLATDPQILDPLDPVPMPAGSGEIRFDSVGFSYVEGEPVLRGVDLVIPGGSAVALVGSTGSGKTTFANLIPRFYDVDEGAVRIDGVDIREVALGELRSEVAFVFQETFLFSSSIAANIRLGDPAADDRTVRSAARLAQAHDFICSMPDGYDTVLGERGATLSGGQRQRIALARSVLRDPRVLILDDATSSVDALVEAEIQSALARVMDGRTTIIIAHRTSTLSLADTVVFLEDGRVAAVGSHEYLLDEVPRYAEVLARDEALAGEGTP